MDRNIDRRRVMKTAGAMALVAAAGAVRSEQAFAQQVPWSSGTESPKLKAPANACDCHMHIYDAKYPARGVAVVDATVTDAELKRLNGLGIRGIRFNLVQAGATTAEMIEPLSRRVNDLGWHIQIHMKGEQIAGIEDLLLRVPSPIVFDHLGRLAQPNALDNPGFKTISKLIDKGRTWVKLSGAYVDTKVGPPTYSDTVAVARAYIKAAPERMVWASDWPHPTEKDKPDDAVLFDLLAEWAPDEAMRTRILVQNPATLYGFPASP